jgi:hypothetical protein
LMMCGTQPGMVSAFPDRTEEQLGELEMAPISFHVWEHYTSCDAPNKSATIRACSL